MPVTTAALTSVGAVLLTRWVWGSGNSVSWALRLGMLLLAGSIAFVLDDPTEPTVGSSPTTLLARRAFRLVPGALVVALGWGLSVSVSGGVLASDSTLMLAGLVAAGAGVSALAGRRAPERSGIAGAGSVLAVLFVIMRLPERWAMLPGVSVELEVAARLRWASMIAIGSALFVFASRDPGRRW